MAQEGLRITIKTLEARLHSVEQLLEKHQVKEAESTAVDSARLELLQLASDLQYFALGPAEWLKVTAAVTKYDHLCYYMIDHFKIHENVPLDRDITYAELSQACGLQVDALTRILRHAMLNHLFHEPRPGYVAHSEASRILVTDPKIASWLGHNYDEVFRSFIALPDALQKYPSASSPGHTACALTFNQPNGYFGGLLQKYPWRAVRFAEAMQGFTKGGHDPSHLVDGYDWGKHANGLVVDVGGSSGFQSVAISKAFPGLKFIVQDIADHSSKLQDHVSEMGVSSDIQFQVHDFFQPNPQTSADVYLLRHIIHDWADENSIKILRNIATVMKPTARIVIVDTVVPEPGVLPWHTDRMIRSLDLQMMVMLNGKERSRQEWSDLLVEAHPKLRILSISQPPYSVASVIEVSLTD